MQKIISINEKQILLFAIKLVYILTIIMLKLQLQQLYEEINIKRNKENNTKQYIVECLIVLFKSLPIKI